MPPFFGQPFSHYIDYAIDYAITPFSSAITPLAPLPLLPLIAADARCSQRY